VALINRLTEAGFTIHPKEVFTSLGAMRELLIARRIKRFVLFPLSHLTPTRTVHTDHIFFSPTRPLPTFPITPPHDCPSSRNQTGHTTR